MTHKPYARVVLKLLQGVISIDDRKDWDLLLHHQIAVRQHFTSIGLSLMLAETDGYAYLTQPRENSDGQTIDLPRLTTSRSLTFEQTLLCVLLRERMDEHENQFGADNALILTVSDIYDLLSNFLKRHSDERRTEKQISGYVRQLEGLGLLQSVRDRTNTYRIQRIIKSRITADVLQSIRDRLIERVEKENES
ncbi:MAG: DUF4194 domain-containing protein [Aggregatilineales bacterium]